MKELLQRLTAIQEKYQFTDSSLASKIGISTDDLQQLRQSKWLDSLRMNMVQRFVEMMEANIFPTKLLTTMDKIFSATYKELAISVIGGVSGSGKTLAAERYSSENTFATYIYVPQIVSPRYLLTMICQKLGLPSIGLSIQQMFEQICAALAEEKRLLIFDEADRLNVKMFEILRDIWHDRKGNLGIAFVGDENLMNKIKRPGTLRENLIRLMRRVKYNEIIDPLHSEDVSMVFKQVLGRHKINDAMIEHVYEKYRQLGAFGSVLHLTDKVLKMSEKSGDTPNNDMVKEAMKRLKL